MPAEAVDLHVDAAEFGDDVRAPCELGDRDAPVGVHLIRLPCVAADADRSAKVVQNQRGVGESACQCGGFGDLVVVAPQLEAQLARRKMSEAGAEVLALIEARARIQAPALHGRVGVPGRDMANAAEAAAAGLEVRIQDRGYAIAQAQVGPADDTGRDPGRTVIPRGAHRGDAGDKLGLADGPEFGGAARAVHRAAFQEHGCDDVVAGVEVGEQFVDEIAVVAALP